MLYFSTAFSYGTINGVFLIIAVSNDALYILAPYITAAAVLLKAGAY